MIYKTIITSLFVAASLICAAPGIQAQKNKSAHDKMHKELLANHKSSIDKSSVSKFLKEEIENRDKTAMSAETSQLMADLLKEAHKHIGKRYIHGAKGPSAFDCSGFSSYVYKQFGYNLSPSSRTQFTQGATVSRNDLRKGDLVFFTSRSSGRNVGHVGIVVSADNEKGTFKFIHASIKGVKVSDFAGYYVPRYLGARRIVTE